MIDEQLAEARRGLRRVHPVDLAAAQAAGALVVDTRPVDQRTRDGEVPGAIVIDRNVLEWRLDPTSGYSIPETAADRRIVVVCNEGYSSSLAAASLQKIGLVHATDLVDGFQGLLQARLLPRRPGWVPYTGAEGVHRPAQGDAS